jgi:Zn-dependent protease
VILGLLTTVLFFGSVLAHELGHSYLALRNNIPVKGITLFVFGGVAQISREPDTPGAEFRIAIAGPLVSLILSLLFALLWLVGQSVPVLAAPSRYLMRINLILAFLNMIPGFPLDGGRVLRALVWWIGKDFYRANRIAIIGGRLVAMGFIGLGIFTMFNGEFFNGIWLVFIGLFLQNAASGASNQTVMQRALTGVTVSQVMNRHCPTVPALMTINQLVEEQVLTGGQRCFFVADKSGLRGLLTLREIASQPQRKWRFTTAEQVMVPIKQVVKVSPNMELLSALQKMDDANIAQVPVLEGEDLVGVLSRESIVHYLRTRAELGI